MKITVLNEMALSREIAVDRCIGLGRRFIEHFKKIYDAINSNNLEFIAHWCKEMQTWLDDAKDIKLKSNNKYLSFANLYDWFFTAGSDYSDYFKDSICDEKYEELIDYIMKENKSVYESIQIIFGGNK